MNIEKTATFQFVQTSFYLIQYILILLSPVIIDMASVCFDEGKIFIRGVPDKKKKICDKRMAEE